MFRILSALLLTTVAAQPLLAQSQGDTARRDIKARLERVRAPMYNDGRMLPEVTATYSVQTTNCRTLVDINMPSHRIGSTLHPVKTEQATLDWNKVRSVKLSDSYVIVADPGLPGGQRYFYAGSPAGAAALKASMDTLAGACFGPAANTPPTSAPSISERVQDKPDILGTPRCRFRHVPELVLTDNTPPVVKTAVYRVRPRESADEDSRFGVGAQSGEQIDNWEGILADPQIVLYYPAHENAQVTRSVVLVDGQPISVPVKPYHTKSFLPNKFSRSVSVSPVTYDPGGLLRAIARGSTMVVQLYVGSRMVSESTFDVRTLRHMPAALKGARWTCR